MFINTYIGKRSGLPVFECSFSEKQDIWDSIGDSHIDFVNEILLIYFIISNILIIIKYMCKIKGLNQLCNISYHSIKKSLTLFYIPKIILLSSEKKEKNISGIVKQKVS